jgi:hypothetical protein
VAFLVAAGAAACGSTSNTSTHTSNTSTHTTTAKRTAARTLATAETAQAIRASILKQRGINTVVTCPPHPPLQSGYRFTCVAMLAVGDYPVSVVETNAYGRVSYSSSAPLLVLDVARVQTAIRLQIRKKLHLEAHVKCPKPVLQKTGIVFKCSATTKRGTMPFTVTEINNYGRVTYVEG